MSRGDIEQEVLGSLPDSGTIRKRLEANLRESRLLRRLLKLAVDREDGVEEDQGRSEASVEEGSAR